MRIEILGTGCTKCQTLASNAEEAARKLGVSYELCKVTSLKEIMQRGVMLTPAIAVDGRVLMQGKVLSDFEIRDLLIRAQ